MRYIVQGNGSGAALAIMDAVAKHNERNPGKELVYLNYAAVDPDLTNSKCSYWHFRLDADTSMKMEALTTFMKEQADIKKVYLINQNYAHGQQVSRYAKENLARKRSDIQVVGDDLHPLAQVRDFAPYVAKIKASGADTVITGNWGSDLTLLVKAAHDAGLDVKFYTYYAGVTGTPTALGATAAGKVFVVAYANSNMPGEVGKLRRPVQGQVQRRLLHAGHLPRVRDALQRDGAGQDHRPGQGGAHDGRPDASRASTATSRCASPTTSCSSRCT